MAKITITTDEGEVIRVMTDDNGDIGDLSFAIVRISFMHDLQDNLKRARRKDNREPENGVKK